MLRGFTIEGAFGRNKQLALAPSAVAVVGAGAEEAYHLRQAPLRPEHFLLGMLTLHPDDIARAALTTLGILDLESVRREVMRLTPASDLTVSVDDLVFGVGAYQVIREADRERRRHIPPVTNSLTPSERIESGHLLLGLARVKQTPNIATEVLRAMGVNVPLGVSGAIARHSPLYANARAAALGDMLNIPKRQ